MEVINIRSLQHYLYCPHRWGLIEIDCAWAENYYVVKADIVHEKAHSATEYSSRGKQVYTSVPVWNDRYGLYGVTDCIERAGNRLAIVEYKPTMPKEREYNESDAMQVFAQKICADEVFGCSLEVYIYYADRKKRVQLPFDSEYAGYEAKLCLLLNEIRSNIRNGVIPKINKGQNCSGCSMKDMCMPGLKKQDSVRERIMTLTRN